MSAHGQALTPSQQVSPKYATVRGESVQPPTFAEQMNSIESLNARLSHVAVRLTTAVNAIHGAPPEQPNDDATGVCAANGMGIVRTLAELTGRAHDTVSAIEHQLERLDRVFG